MNAVPKYFYIYEPIFKEHYICMVGPNWTDALLRQVVDHHTGVTGMFNPRDSIEDQPTGRPWGITWSHVHEGRSINIIYLSEMKHSLLVHEVVHAIAGALQPRGVPFTPQQETYSYLAGYLFELFWEAYYHPPYLEQDEGMIDLSNFLKCK